MNLVFGILLSMLSVELPQTAAAAKQDDSNCGSKFERDLPEGAITDAKQVERTLASFQRRWNNSKFLERGMMETDFKETKYNELSFNGVPRAMELSFRGTDLLLNVWILKDGQQPKMVEQTIPVTGKMRELGKNGVGLMVYQRAYLMPITDTKNGNTEPFPYLMVTEQWMEGETEPLSRVEIQFWFEPSKPEPGVITTAIVKANPTLEVTKTGIGGWSSNRIVYQAVDSGPFPPTQAAPADPLAKALPEGAHFDVSKVAAFAGDWVFAEVQSKSDDGQWIPSRMDRSFIGIPERSVVTITGNTITSVDDGTPSQTVVDGKVYERIVPSDDPFVGNAKVRSRAYLSATNQLIVEEETKTTGEMPMEDFTVKSIYIDENGNLVTEADTGILGPIRIIQKRDQESAT